MASLPVQGIGHLSRLTTAAKLARVLTALPVRVDPPTVVRTERLLIRPAVWTDREGYIRAVRESRAGLDEFCPLHLDGETDDALFDRHLELARIGDVTGRAWRRVVEDQQGRMVGAVNINDIAHGLESKGELNIWVRTPDAGRGYATEMVSAAMKHALRSRSERLLREGEGRLPGLGLERVDALIAPRNSASLAVVRRHGFIANVDAPVQLLRLHGREVEHHRFSLFAAAGTGMVRDLDEHPPRVRSSLRAVLAIEAAAAEQAA